MGFSTEPIRQVGWFEWSLNPPCLNHQQIDSDELEGAIRHPIQQEEVVGRALRGSVCSLPLSLRDWDPDSIHGHLVLCGQCEPHLI